MFQLYFLSDWLTAKLKNSKEKEWNLNDTDQRHF